MSIAGRKPKGVRPHRTLSISMYHDDLDLLDRKVSAVQGLLSSKQIDRSKLIRVALEMLDAELAAAHLGSPAVNPETHQTWTHRRLSRAAIIVDRSFWIRQAGSSAADSVSYRFIDDKTEKVHSTTVENFLQAFRS